MSTILDDIKGIKSTRRDLRKFGLSVGGVLLVIGALLWWYSRPAGPYLAAAGIVLIALGLVLPGALVPLQKAWMTVAVVIGWFQTRLILCLLFYAVLTPLRFFGILLRKDPLGRRQDPGAKTYWNYTREAKTERERCERTF